MKLPKYSFGIGDRFGQQGMAQLKALIKANNDGYEFIPVWNKSNREHEIIHSKQIDTKYEAEEAVNQLGWDKPYFIDADHININNVEKYIETSNFFTIDVAEKIGEEATKQEINAFYEKNKHLVGKIKIPHIETQFGISSDRIREIGKKFIHAIKEAGEIYRLIESRKGKDNFVTEISMDEVDEPQRPVEMLFILKALADENIPVQTIAPKFTGRFNKGIDYSGDIDQFTKEFEEDLLVTEYAVKEFGLPENLKLSIHSGSDKFSLYPIIGKLLKKYDKGIHVKTAGTTWLEEVIGLSLAGGKAFELIKKIYGHALRRIDELSEPYANVIEINIDELPSAEEVNNWTGQKMADSIRHIPGHKDFNPNMRQLLHIGYKIAAEYSDDYIAALRENKDIVNEQVTENIYERHIKRFF